MTEPRVSVIVPVYNGERYLRPCIDSILGQTFRDMEIILVNDGSTDASAAMLAEYAAKDERIRVEEHANCGVGATRNKAIELARGEYIRFIDCDDTLPEDSIEVLVRRADETKSDLVISAYEELLLERAFLRDLLKKDETVDCNSFLKDFSRYPNSFYYGVLWNKLFRRDIIMEHGIRFDPSMTWGEDFTFVVQYLVHVQRVSYMRKPVYVYRRNPNGLTMAMVPHCFKHPLRSIGFRVSMFKNYRRMFIERGIYEQFKNRLWMYLVTFTINQ